MIGAHMLARHGLSLVAARAARDSERRNECNPVQEPVNGGNIQEGGRRQTLRASPDGSPNLFRIVDPRQFILSATFDL